MIFLEKSELPFSKCPTKNYITPSSEVNTYEYNSIPLKIRTAIPPPPPPFISQSPRSGCFFFISNFLYLKITDNAQLCTGKIRIIPSSNIENRP